MRHILIFAIFILITISCSKKTLDNTEIINEKAVKTVIAKSDAPNYINDKYLKKKINFKTIKMIIEDPQVDLEDRRLNKVISNYNKKIIMLLKEELEISGEIKKYHNLIFSGCSPELQGCNNLGKFYLFSNTIELLVDFSDLFQEKNITLCYFYLRSALSINNNIAEYPIMLRYLKNAYKYKETIVSDLDKLKQHYRELSRIISNREALEDKKEFIDFIENFPFFKNISGAFEKKLLAIALETKKDFIYEEDNSLSSLIKNEIKKVTQLDVTLTNEEYEYFKATFNLERNIYDEYYLLISSIYNGHLSREELMLLWKHSKQDLTKLKKCLDTFVKSKFLYSLKKSNQVMIRFFKEKNFSPTTYFVDISDKSKEGANIWNQFHQRINMIQAFAAALLNGSSEKETKLKIELQKNLFKPLRSNIKYMAVFPQMFMMIHFFSKRKYNITFKTFWGQEYVIGPSDVYLKFYKGTYEAFFKYGNDQKQITSEEIVYSFFFALKGGLFKYYAGINNEHSFIYDIFKESINQLTAKEYDSIKKAKESLNSYHLENTLYKTYLKFCEYSKNPSIDHPLEQVISLTEFSAKPFTGNKTSAKIFNKTIYSNQITKIEDIHLRTNRNLEKIKTMVSMYEEYLVKTGVSKRQRTKYINRINKLFSPLEHQIISLQTLFIKAHNDLKDCVFPVHYKNEEIQKKLLHREKMYLRSLYQHYLQYRDKKISLEVLNGLYKNAWDPNYKTLDLFTERTLVYHREDFLMRMRKFMTGKSQIVLIDGDDQEEITLKPLTSAIQVSVPFTKEQWEKEEAHNHESYPSQNISLYHSIQTKDGETIYELLTEDEFISECFKQIAGTYMERKFTEWFIIKDGSDLSLSYFSSMIKGYTVIYKSDNLRIYNDLECASKEKSNGCKTSKTSIDVNSFIDLAKTIYEYSNITDEKAKILNSLNISNPIEDGIAHILRNPNKKSIKDWNTFDKMFFHIKAHYNEGVSWLSHSDNNRKIVDPLRVPNQVIAENYYIARTTRDPFIFNTAKNIEKTMDKKYSDIIEFEFNKIDNFIKEIKKIDKDHPILTAPIRYGVNDYLEREIVNEELFDNYYNRVETFHKKMTNNFFRQKKQP